jgi:two-component system cell cycle response regulator
MHGRILVVDDVATNRIIYKVKLGDAFYEPLLAADGRACLAKARAERPDLILLDLGLPDMSGTEVLRELRNDPLTRHIPVIVVTADRNPEERQRALSAGADDVMAKPVIDQLLLARIRNLLRARGEQGMVASAWGMPPDTLWGGSEDQPLPMALAEPAATFEQCGLVALVSEHPETALRWRNDLRNVLRDTLVIMSRDQAMSLTPADEPGSAPVPDVFVIEGTLDGPNGGLRLMSELDSRPATRHAATCIITPLPESEATSIAYDMGADDVVTRGISPRELALRLRILIRRKRQADRMRATLADGLKLAMIDPLTGIYNRRYAMPRLAGIAAQAAQEGTTFAVMVVDLDRFKSVNDSHGHAAGDRVLAEVAHRLSENLRVSDLLARIGGEEFLVALPQTSFDDAQAVADRLCQVIAERPITLMSGQPLRVTASIGVALGQPGTDGVLQVEPLIDRADQALLQSKSDGRNKVTFANRSAA